MLANLSSRPSARDFVQRGDAFYIRFAGSLACRQVVSSASDASTPLAIKTTTIKG